MNSISKPRYIDGVSSGASVTGEWLNIRGITKIGFLAKWTGTTLGVFVVETSYDGVTKDESTRLDIPTGLIGANALTLTAAMIAAFPAGGASQFEFVFDKQVAPWIRFSYTRTSGTGVLRVAAAGKNC